MTLLTRHISRILGFPPPGSNINTGDFVFSQGALDALISQLHSNAPSDHHPASESAIASLKVIPASESKQAGNECPVCLCSMNDNVIE